MPTRFAAAISWLLPTDSPFGGNVNPPVMVSPDLETFPPTAPAVATFVLKSASGTVPWLSAEAFKQYYRLPRIQSHLNAGRLDSTLRWQSVPAAAGQTR